MSATNSATCGTPGCFQYHSNIQMPMRASGGSPAEGFQLLLSARDVDLLVETELHDLLEAIDHVGSLHQQEQHVRIGGAGLDQIGGEIGGAERGEFVAGDRAAELFQISRAGFIERVAKGVVRRDEVPFLAVLVVQQVRIPSSLPCSSCCRRDRHSTGSLFR